MEKRLQKIISELGITSRRKAEEMITEGRLRVNGQVAVLGTKADPEFDHIKLDGKLLTGTPGPKIYLVFNKPRSVMTSLEDPGGRQTVKDFMKNIKQRVYPVGRLDYDSEGLLILTNDGEFANAVLHPSKKVPKVYEVKISGVLSDHELTRLREGIRLDDGMTAPAKVRTLRKAESKSWVEITITEGRKRQIRRMMHNIRHHVTRLRRVKVGPLPLGRLKPGEMRYLSNEEVSRIKDKIGMHKEA